MNPQFDELFTKPENNIFKVVFYPDRVYHAQYLNATRSSRYRYNVREVRSKHDITVMKGDVYLDGQWLTNFMRLEYRASRLVELAREKNRFLRGELLAWLKLLPTDESLAAETNDLKLTYCPWIDAYQVEIWQTTEPPAGSRHDIKVIDLMGKNGSITRIKQFTPALDDLKALRRVEVAMRENNIDLPFGYTINNPEWDNNYLRSHQVPNTADPSSQLNTIEDSNYLIDFQRGWFLQSEEVEPVRYRNAMMNNDDAERHDNNVIEMRWLLQRELGGTVVFFHEVTIPPGTIEGTHRHIGTEELYYITQGTGTAYIGENDDPGSSELPTVKRELFGLDPRPCKEVAVKPGSVIFTKSGGIHGIKNEGDEPLKFVAFLYHSS